MACIKLKTTVHVLDQLGGDDKVATILGTTAKAVGNWRYTNSFPNHTYLAIKAMLNHAGYDAPNSLWPMTPIPRLP